MLIASKIHDVSAMKTEQFTYLSADSYTESQVVKMEQMICSTLRFHLHIATPCHFAHRFLRASFVSANQYLHVGSHPPACGFDWENSPMQYMVEYLLELALLEYHCVYWEPSVVAASAVYLARATLDIHDYCGCAVHAENEDKSQEKDYGHYSKALEHYTGHTLDHISTVVKIINLAHRKQTQQPSSSSPLRAVYDKYSSRKYKRVALKIPVSKDKLFPWKENDSNTSCEGEESGSDDDSDSREESSSEEDSCSESDESDAGEFSDW